MFYPDQAHGIHPRGNGTRLMARRLAYLEENMWDLSFRIQIAVIRILENRFFIRDMRTFHAFGTEFGFH